MKSCLQCGGSFEGDQAICSKCIESIEARPGPRPPAKTGLAYGAVAELSIAIASIVFLVLSIVSLPVSCFVVLASANVKLFNEDPLTGILLFLAGGSNFFIWFALYAITSRAQEGRWD